MKRLTTSSHLWAGRDALKERRFEQVIRNIRCGRCAALFQCDGTTLVSGDRWQVATVIYPPHSNITSQGCQEKRRGIFRPASVSVVGSLVLRASPSTLDKILAGPHLTACLGRHTGSKQAMSPVCCVAHMRKNRWGAL